MKAYSGFVLEKCSRVVTMYAEKSGKTKLEALDEFYMEGIFDKVFNDRLYLQSDAYIVNYWIKQISIKLKRCV